MRNNPKKNKNSNKKSFFYPSEKYLNSIPQREQRQLKFIIRGNLIFSLGFLLMGVMLYFQKIKFLPELAALTCVCFVVSLILIKKDKLYIGAYFSTLGIIIAVFIILFFGGTYQSSLVYYRDACFVVTMAICNQLVALKKRQIIAFFASAGTLWLVEVATTMKFHFAYASFMGTISAVVICTLAIVLANTVILELNLFNQKLVENANDAEKKAENNLRSITKMIDDSKNGLEMGERLYSATQKASGSIFELNNIYNVISEGSTGLTEEATTINNAGNSVKSQAEQMKATIQNQNDSIAATSEEMQKITTNLSSLSDIAGNHKNIMNDVVQNLNNQMELITKLVDEVKRVQESSQSISKFVQTVDNVASRTGLLAMNASIEAAHVGQQGKGFTVIAQEIRKLSNETALNATRISDGLAENDKIVQETADSVAGFQEFTQKTTEDLKKTIYAIEEILAGILSINNESQNVMGSLQSVVEQSYSTNSIVDNVVSEIESQAVALEKMADFTNTLNESVAGMEARVNDIKEVLEGIETEAKQNVLVTRNITDSLDARI